MLTRKLLVLAVIGGCSAGVLAAEWVGVAGSDAKFLTPLEKRIGEQDVKLRLTGVAMRKKLFFNVYAVASYVQDGTKLKTPEQLANRNVAKGLHLVMVRDVDGPTMAEAFESAIRANYPEPAFSDEIKTLTDFMRSTSVAVGDQIWLTHVPNLGFHCEIIGKTQFIIRNKDFSKAIWDIYLGPNNLGETVKKGLTSRL